MWFFRKISPRCFCRLLVAFLTFITFCKSQEVSDFIAVNSLPDGEVETRINYRGVRAKETTVGKSAANRITFREITNGKQLVQLVFTDDNDLKDCEIIRQKAAEKKFLDSFESDLSNLMTTSNITIESLDDKPLPEDIMLWFNFTALRDSCRKLHRAIRKQLKIEDNQLHRWSAQVQKRSVFILPGTLWCGDSHNAKHYRELGAMSKTDRCCRKHDHCKRIIKGFSTRFHYHNYSPFTISHCYCDLRRKRFVTDLLSVPGTKWCGKGYSADKYTRLGGFSRTDKCCRRHDTSCPFWIGAFETKYGLFNWRVNTIMHCSCDERFRACLKMVDTSDANLVGKLFFNIVQTKCFVIKPKKVCVKNSWWGQCEKYKHIKQAVLRDNIPY